MKISGQLPAAPLFQSDAGVSWRRRLGAIVSHPSQRQTARYIDTTVCERIASIRRKPRNRPSVDGDAPDRFELGFGEAGAAFGRAAPPVLLGPGSVLAPRPAPLAGARRAAPRS